MHFPSVTILLLAGTVAGNIAIPTITLTPTPRNVTFLSSGQSSSIDELPILQRASRMISSFTKSFLLGKDRDGDFDGLQPNPHYKAKRATTDDGLIDKFNHEYGKNDWTNGSFVTEDCGYKCERTCETDARVALWKWRYVCDRDYRNFWPVYYCMRRAPHPNKCCPKDKSKRPKNCDFFAPKNDTEAFSCRNNCIGRNFNSSCAEGFWNWCPCQFWRCKVITPPNLEPVEKPEMVWEHEKPV